MKPNLKIAAAEAKPKIVTILGATGSVGRNALALVEGAREKFQVAVLTGNSNAKLLAEQARRVNAACATIADESKFSELKRELQGSGIKAMAGQKAIEEAATVAADLVISAIVGIAGLKPTLAAIKSGAAVGLANKESLVSSGKFFMEARHHHQYGWCKT